MFYRYVEIIETLLLMKNNLIVRLSTAYLFLGLLISKDSRLANPKTS
jgi:hypothetical protein